MPLEGYSAASKHVKCTVIAKSPTARTAGIGITVYQRSESEVAHSCSGYIKCKSFKHIYFFTTKCWMCFFLLGCLNVA